METITNAANTVASTVSKTIFGEGDQTSAQATESAKNETAGTEPVSGLQGKGTAAEPYDQGNSEDSAPTSTTVPKETPEIPASTTESITTGLAADTSAKPEKTGIAADVGSESTPLSDAPTTSALPETKTQNAEASTTIPSAAGTSAITDKKSDGETLVEKSESNTGNPGGHELGKEKGTGEQWVKTSGLAADGGDFDASKPGAGKEADRLLEQKSATKSEPSQVSSQPAATSSKDTKASGEKEKVSLGEKIKNKLHIGHKDKDKK